ncbi:MAG TPA: flavodoxin family protein [Bacillota bacterium]|nr:flavodoxin family protein [Bacillota bacterium]HPW42123.1 flavodoxin family protein [Bacillota bacterium]
MKAVILNGGKENDLSIAEVLGTIVKELEATGADIRTFDLRDMNISRCLGCFNCWVKTPGVCIIDDDGRMIAKEAVQSDLVIFLTPVVFGGYSPELKMALDRLIPIVSPFFTKIQGEVHHKPRYKHYPSLVGIGILPENDQNKEKIFKTLVNKNAVNMHNPSWAACVLSGSQPAEQIRQQIKESLAKVGVIE